MPHITQHDKEQILSGTRSPYKFGDACWLFATWMLNHYNENPSWTAIHECRVAARAPFHNAETQDIIRQHLGTFQKTDIEAASDLAFFEFYRLIGARHEDVKILENGNALAGAAIPQVPVETLAEVNDNLEFPVVKRGRGRPRKVAI